ncbi:MAG: response regulator [Phycisphaerae bacterium]
MPRSRVLDVGNCDLDHGAIRALLVNHFEVDVDRAMFVDEALARLAQDRYDLVLVNRRIFADDSDGLALVRRVRAVHARPDDHSHPPVMMISNFETAQRAAVEAGALRGFGKARLGDAATIERLAQVLPRKHASRDRTPAGVDPAGGASTAAGKASST